MNVKAYLDKDAVNQVRAQAYALYQYAKLEDDAMNIETVLTDAQKECICYQLKELVQRVNVAYQAMLAQLESK